MCVKHEGKNKKIHKSILCEKEGISEKRSNLWVENKRKFMVGEKRNIRRERLVVFWLTDVSCSTYSSGAPTVASPISCQCE